MSIINYNDPNSPWLPPGYDPYKGMSDEEREKSGCMQSVILAVFFIIILTAMVLFGSCTTTKYVPVVEHHADTLIQVQHHRDSIYLHDSVYVSQWQQGDTVWVEKVKWRSVWMNHTTHDTIYQVHTDSIPYPVEVTKEVPAALTWWQQTRIHAGGIVLWMLIFLCAYKIIKMFLRYK